MKTFIALLLGILSGFYMVFYFFKLYQWYAPHTGELYTMLPQTISYLEMYAICVLTKILTGIAFQDSINGNRILRLLNYEKDMKDTIVDGLTPPAITSILFVLSYLLYLILY